MNAYVIGSDEEENFSVTMEGDKVVVVVSTNNSKKKEVLYRRVFDPKDTKKIHLLGLNGNDQFYIAENVSSPIRVLLLGGDGEDTFTVKGKIKTTIEDKADSKSIALKR